MNTKEWLKTAKFTSWWIEWDDILWPSDRLTQKWNKRAEIFSRAGVNGVVIFGIHFRWDWIEYFPRVHGLLAEIVKICHDHGMKVVDHHSATLTHHAHSIEDRKFINDLQMHHLPLYPEKYENRSFKGRKLTDWRMRSAVDNELIYYPGYRSYVFCPNNPDYQKSYLEYIDILVSETGVDGVMSDDLHFLPNIYTCGCEHCRAKFLNEAGMELPDTNDKSFWENYDNAAFQKWIEMRFRSNAEHYKRVRDRLPQELALWGCMCSNLMPHKINQGASYEDFSKYCDAVFVENFHQLDPVKDRHTAIADICAASSLAKLRNKELLVLFYANSADEHMPWLDILNRVGGRPWLTRQVRLKKPIQEEDIFVNGYPQSSIKEWNKAKSAVVFSSILRNRLGPDNKECYNAFVKQCAELWDNDEPFDVLFDNEWPENIAEKYEEIYIPEFSRLTIEQQDLLFACKEKSNSIREYWQ